jgi:hypothetical protein
MSQRNMVQMFESLINSYQAFDVAAQTYDREYNMYPQQDSKHARNRTTLRNAFNNFVQSMQNNELVIHGFIVTYDSRLQSLYSLFRQQHFRGLDFLPRFQQLFNTNMIDTTTTSTKLFNEFIKGITFFHNEIDYPFNMVPQPLYHRNVCCGAADGPITNVEKCFIERMIYDDIYKKFGIHFPETLNINDNRNFPDFDNRFFQRRQDNGHENWLFNVVKQLYFTSHSDVDKIELEVNKDIDSNIPLTLSIKKIFKNGKYVEDYYEKTYKVTMYLNQVYEENVKCKRSDTTSGNTKLYSKTQTFEKEAMWVETIIGGKSKKRTTK